MVDPTIQPRVAVNRDAVSTYATKYRTAGSQALPPLKAARLSDAEKSVDPFERQNFVIIDGHHRFLAAEKARLSELPVVIVDCDTRAAKWMAAQANLSHGVQLKRKEHREVFKRFIEAKQNVTDEGSLISYRDISLALGNMRSHETIRHWMKDDFPALYHQMAAGDGLELAPEAFERADPLDEIDAVLRTSRHHLIEGLKRARSQNAQDIARFALAGLTEEIERHLGETLLTEREYRELLGDDF